MKALERIDRWIFDEFQPCARGLPLFRILFALFILVFYFPRFSPLAGIPPWFFHPPLSFATFIPGVPPGWFYYLLDFLGELSALCLLFGYRTRIAGSALLAAILIGNTYRFSIGPKIDHEILILAILFCLGFSGWGNRLSHDEKRISSAERLITPSWPIALLVLIVSFCMLTAVYPKALSGWASPHVLACHGQMIANYVQMERPSSVADHLLQIQTPIFWKMADYSTLFIEAGFIFCIFSLPASRSIASAAVIFHALIFYSMCIFFSANLMAYACLLDLRRFLWNGRVRHSVSRFGRLARRIRFPHLFILALAFLGLRLALDDTDIDLMFLPNNLLILIALVIAVVSILYSVASLADRLIFGHAFPLRANHSLVILYDGECGLCDKWVQFVLKHDHRSIFRFAPLQSQAGKELLREAVSTESDLSSMILIIDRKAYFRSTGALMILRQLGGFWSLSGTFGFVPASLRDAAYSLVAANRHRWFPKAGDSCQLLSPVHSGRFLS